MDYSVFGTDTGTFIMCHLASIYNIQEKSIENISLEWNKESNVLEWINEKTTVTIKCMIIVY